MKMAQDRLAPSQAFSNLSSGNWYPAIVCRDFDELMITEFYYKNDIKGIKLFALLMFGDRFCSGHAKKFKG
jgi:hypothetical protein